MPSKHRLTWHKTVPRVGPAFYRGHLGPVTVIYIRWSLLRPGHYELQSYLPEVNSREGSPSPYVKDLKEAFNLAEEVVDQWLKLTGLDRG